MFLDTITQGVPRFYQNKKRTLPARHLGCLPVVVFRGEGGKRDDYF